MNRALRCSDVVPRREWERRELWYYIARPRGHEDNLWLWLDVPGDPDLHRIAVATRRRDGFPDRDVRVLELLTPHLIRLYTRAARRRETARGLEMLTPREREVIALIAAGMTNREAARYLWVSPHTVRAHLENIFEKLEVTFSNGSSTLPMRSNVRQRRWSCYCMFRTARAAGRRTPPTRRPIPDAAVIVVAHAASRRPAA